MNLNLALEFMIFIAGAYFASLFFKLKYQGEIPKSLVSPRNANGMVRDKEGYTNYVFLRGVIGCVVLCITSLVILACDVYALNPIVDLTASVLNAVSIVYLAVICLKGQKRFLDKE